MARRPRPASRRPPARVLAQNTEKYAAQSSATQRKTPQAARKRPEPEPEPESSESEEGEDEVEDEDEDGGAFPKGSDVDMYEEDEEAVDVDGARVAQWVDEEELDEPAEEEREPESSSDEEEPGHLTASQQAELSSLPFGTLRKAQKALARASALGDAEDDEHSEVEDDDSEPEQAGFRADMKGKGRATDDAPKPKQAIPKRKSKNAPVEMNSKRPVPRRKLEVEEPKVVPRDPRFLPLVGEFSSKRFQAQYGFLSEMHTEEMKTLRDNLKRARKLLAHSPGALRAEREREVQRLERAYKRAESVVNRDRREKIDQDALERAAREEKEKRKAGKGSWFMKKSDKKELLLKAKFDALAASGGQAAVRKAIEKKQKKESQKEKKRRPFAPGQPAGAGGGAPRKRAHGAPGGDGGRSGKRRRVG